MTTPTVRALPPRAQRKQPLPSPDFVVETAPRDNSYIVGPCHSVAADWLQTWAKPSSIWVGNGLSLDTYGLRELISAAPRAGFTLRLLFGFQPQADTVETLELGMTV
jgi:hypothetical protein